MSNKITNSIETLYREKYLNFEDMLKPEMIFTLFTKNISYYNEYKLKLTKDNTNAITLETPSLFANCRNIFEFYIIDKIDLKIPFFIISEHNSFCKSIIELKKDLFIYLRYTVNICDDNYLNSFHPDKEVILFKENNILKSISLS